MDSNHDADARIAQLEQEIALLRGEPPRPKATRVAPQPAMPKRTVSATWILVGLIAASAPVAAWVIGESRGERAAKMQRKALHLEAKLSLAERRHEVAREFLDVALDPHRSPGDRDQALRYLADELGPKSKLRRWAKKELARSSEARASSCSKRKAAKAKALREALEREQRAELARSQSQSQNQSCGG
jgi:hypothetical protein